MKKLSNLLCVILTFLISFSFVSCKNKCDHSYALSSLICEKTETKSGVYICSKCKHKTKQEVTYKEIGLPTIDFMGSLDGISKQNELNISVVYSSENMSFECDAKIKVQGDRSTTFPKKNYTIKLYEKETDFDKKFKVELVDGWGKENKYCLKANWIDYSQARNVVSAKLFGQIVHSRNIEDEINNLYNGGGIDGYPVVIYLNGSFLGLYTLNIPKDKWLFNMDDYDPEKDQDIKKQAILMGDTLSNSSSLKETMNSDYTSSGWELEYCSTEDCDIGTDWVAESFNSFINILNTSSNEELKLNLPNYVDLNRAIDCLIYTNVILGVDNTANNLIWVTYDGSKWIPSMYDMDGTWGLAWNGALYDEQFNKSQILIENKLYEKLIELYFDKIQQRYIQLRSNILSISNIENAFMIFFDSIPNIVRNAEKTKWQSVPNQQNNNLEQIKKFTNLRLTILDEYFVFKNH